MDQAKVDFTKLTKEALLEHVERYVSAGFVWDIEGKPEASTKSVIIDWLSKTIAMIPTHPPGAELQEGDKPLQKERDATPIGVSHSPKIPGALYYRGVRILSVTDQIISGKIFKSIQMENGLGFKLSLEQYADEVIVKHHE
jgi:hypothetical protein